MVKCGATCILPPVLKWGFSDLTPAKLFDLVSWRAPLSRGPSTYSVTFVRKHSVVQPCWVDAPKNPAVLCTPQHSGKALARKNVVVSPKNAAVVTKPQQESQSPIGSSSPSLLGQNLNEEQRAAVETPENCVRVVAGPGSGKTLVLTHRIAHLITVWGINPSSILCLTFTNKAKDELRQRLLKLLGKDALKLTIGTFHSVCVRILREFATEADVGFDKDFAIYDDQDSERVVKRVLGELAETDEKGNGESRGRSRKKLGSQEEEEGDDDFESKQKQKIPISAQTVQAMSRGIADFKLGSQEEEEGEDDSKSKEKKPKQKQKISISSQTVKAMSKGIAELKEFELRSFVAKQTQNAQPLRMPPSLRSFRREFDRYQKALREANAADFDDLIHQTVRILYRRPELRKGHERGWSHVLADEFQDTDWAQYVFLRLLCGTNRNLFVVGDVDQAIYGWRGADYKHMEDLDKHFRGVATFELRRNYRSSQNILQLATEVISRSQRQSVSLKPLKLEAVGPRGADVEYHLCHDSNYEATYVVDSIKDLVAKKKAASFGSCGILFRKRTQGDVFEMWCLTRNVPYTVSASTTLLSRKEVKDLRAYLQLIWNPDDALALTYIINSPPRGLGQTTLMKIGDWASGLRLPLPRALKKFFSEETSHKELGITSRARKSLLQFCQLLEDLRKQSETEPVSELIQEVFNRTEMLDYYQKMNEPNMSERGHHLRLFQDLAKSTELVHGVGRPALRGFLESIALNSDLHEGIAGPADAVRLSTLHAAKGLEFDYVFIAGADEGTLPISNSDLEEERRLFYVGITRARKGLYITSRRRVMSPGEGYRNSRVSQFLSSLTLNTRRNTLYSESGGTVFDEAID